MLEPWQLYTLALNILEASALNRRNIMSTEKCRTGWGSIAISAEKLLWVVAAKDASVALLLGVMVRPWLSPTRSMTHAEGHTCPHLMAIVSTGHLRTQKKV
jgi:hypothetical protein